MPARDHLRRPQRRRVVPATAARSATPRLVVLARLVPHKQVEHAFHVVDRLRDELPDLHLDVIGEGWWRRRLGGGPSGARPRGPGHASTATCRTTSATGCWREAWVMLLPSVKEGWGLAIMEAAAQGTPTIAYASAGGVRESIVDGETGLLVDDQDGLVDAARALLVDAGRRRRGSGPRPGNARRPSAGRARRTSSRTSQPGRWEARAAGSGGLAQSP